MTHVHRARRSQAPRRSASTRRRLGLFAAAALALLLGGCPPTLSKPRGADHLRAMKEAGEQYSRGEMEQAAATYERAARTAERRVDRDEALYRSAKALARAGHKREAIARLDEVASYEPPSRRTVRARFDAALLRLEVGEREAGLRTLREVVERHPEHGLASRALQMLLREARERGGPEAALALLEELGPRTRGTDLGDDVLAAEAEIARELGDNARAKQALQRLVDQYPYPEGERWDDALAELAELAVEEGEHARAVAYLEQMVAVHSETIAPGSYTLPTFPRAQLEIARIYRDHLNDPVAAAAAFEKVYTNYPTSIVRDDAMLELGELYLKLGRKREACEIFRRVVREFEVGRSHRRAEEHLRGC